MKRVAATGVLCALLLLRQVVAAPPAFVDMTWMSISNMYYEIGALGVVTDGYITRLPQSAFFGGGGGYAQTRQPFRPDVAAVTRVMDALGRPSKVKLLLTGHSHWDHSFDTATWSKLTGARIMGSQTTCLQARAEDVPAERCRAVFGGEAIALAEGVTLRVVRWNHSGDPAVNPEQHNAVELKSVPVPHVPIVIDGMDHGAPLENLKAAMKEAKLRSVDLWIGSGGVAVAKLVVPVLKPKSFIPVHWDGLWGAFEAGVPKPYGDPTLEAFLQASGTAVMRPAQYMDKWRLDRGGVRPIPNLEVKKALGF